MVLSRTGRPTTPGPILFAYDGSDLAALAIAEAGRQFEEGREAVVVCVWQPVDVGFHPVGDKHFDADAAPQVRAAAEVTAAHGASLAREAGFMPTSVTKEAAPTWQGIIDAAAEHQAGVIVVGTHRRKGVMGHLVGTVAAAVIAHSGCPVLVIHAPASE